ncbi:DUF2924 domain-containing protein [Aquisediminimonas profunda]|uniref:DUF2924 domain-containing protein n=1 Tax=Aquisediminimonas profunda TaxID=1550733 RepID=UPI001C627C1B|nr:DUF2924 domain-containing protein [Aquisediminimonas profunda]
MSGAPLNDRIAALATMSLAQLCIEWRRVWKTTPPEITVDLLARSIAWKLQAQVYGGHSPETMRKLKALTSGRAGDPVAGTLKPGTRILREWNGRSINVLAIEGGFLFEDRSYRSLSEIAREVTGTKWSGPRFFGMKAKRRAA